MKKQFRRGKLLTLILLLLGLAVTVIYFFAEPGEWIVWIAPFNVPCILFSNWFDPARVFVPLALLALAGWMMLHLGRLFGREIIIAAMVVYLACNLVLIPFYSLLVSASSAEAEKTAARYAVSNVPKKAYATSRIRSPDTRFTTLRRIRPERSSARIMRFSISSSSVIFRRSRPRRRISLFSSRS